MLLEGQGEGDRAGQEALLQDLEHELGRLAGSRVHLFAQVACVVLEQGVEAVFGLGVRHLDGFDLACLEARVPFAVLQLGLQAADNDRIDLLLVLALQASHEALVVEQVQQGREALGLAVVRGGREEELVLEVRRDRADRLGALGVHGVLAAARGRDVVGLVDDQEAVATGIE